MRKKEPPSPTMPAAGRDAQRTQAVARALQWKRRSIDKEIEDFLAKKELEFKNYEERLSNGLEAPDQLDGEANAASACPETAQNSRIQASKLPHLQPDVADASAPAPPSTSAANNNNNGDDRPSPTTPRHDKERELHGLFLPHFIPLLDHASSSSKRTSDKAARAPPSSTSASPPRPQSSSSSLFSSPSLPSVTTTSELPGRLAGANPNDPSTLSPRTSPSPTLIATIFPLPASTISSREDSPASSSPHRRSPSPIEELASDLPLLTRSPRRLPTRREPSPTDDGLLSPKPVRPQIGTRSSSTQSDASTHSLRSSLRKANGDVPSHGRKKSVRISIDDIVLAPGGESPVQAKTAWRIPERKNSSSDDASVEVHDWENLDSESMVDSAWPQATSKTAHVENIDESTLECDLSATSSRKKSASRDKSGRKQRKQPKSLDLSSMDKGSSGSRSIVSSGKTRAYDITPNINYWPEYFPPKPLTSPSKSAPVRPHGTDLIEPLRTPPASASEVEQDDIFGSDPLFGDGGSGESSRSSSRDGWGGASRRRGADDLDEEDMFQDYEDGREEHDVVNGHDLDDGEEDVFGTNMGTHNRTHNGTHKRNGVDRTSRDGGRDDTWDANGVNITSTSPHAGSLPIEIRGPKGWDINGWR